MAMSNRDTGMDTAGARRIKYGLNVAIGIVAAIAIVIILNIITYKYLERVRFDTTHSRIYSVSDQTRKILRSLKNEYEVVTLVIDTHTYYKNATDLIQEYGYYSDKVTVTHLDPTGSRGQKFFESILAQYQHQLSPLRQAIERGQEAHQQAASLTSQHGQTLNELISDPNLSDEQRQFAILIANFFARFEDDLSRVRSVIESRLETPLPDLQGLLDSLRQPLESLEKALDESDAQFKLWISDPATAPSVKDRALRLSAAFKQLRSQLQEWIGQLRDAETGSEYGNIRDRLTGRANTVAILGPKEVRVIPLDDMFRQPSQEQLESTGNSTTIDPAFIGEEQITGALVSLELDQKPLVVFVNSGQQPAIGPRGMYQHVADRLETMNFEAKEWNQMGQPGFGGQRMPPGPPPQAAPGQKAIWVVPPSPPANPMAPNQNMGGQQVADTIKDQLDQGHAALIMFGPKPGMGFGATDPLVDVVAPWGITPQVDRQIYRERIVSDRRPPVADNAIIIDDWPAEATITEPLRGMQAVFPAASPLVLETKQTTSTRHWTLARATGRRLWASSDFTQRNPKYDEATAANSFVIAAAAEKDQSRVIVVSDVVWASNQITTYGVIPGLGGGPGLAEVAGAAFPANAELFVNCIYWLAELDELIARSARTQDIRRVEQMTPGGLQFTRWVLLLGLPLITLVAGMSVWMVRRQG